MKTITDILKNAIDLDLVTEAIEEEIRSTYEPEDIAEDFVASNSHTIADLIGEHILDHFDIDAFAAEFYEENEDRIKQLVSDYLTAEILGLPF